MSLCTETQEKRRPINTRGPYMPLNRHQAAIIEIRCPFQMRQPKDIEVQLRVPQCAFNFGVPIDVDQFSSWVRESK